MAKRVIKFVGENDNNEYIVILVGYENIMEYEKSIIDRTFKPSQKPLPQLSKILGGVDLEKLPTFLFYHGHVGKVYNYPKPLTDMHENSATLVHAWALKSMFEGDAPYMQEFITGYMEEQLAMNPDMP